MQVHKHPLLCEILAKVYHSGQPNIWPYSLVQIKTTFKFLDILQSTLSALL